MEPWEMADSAAQSVSELHVNRIDGQDIYLTGHPFPMHGFVNETDIISIDRAKRALKRLRICEAYKNIYYLSFKSFSVFPAEIRRILGENKLSIVISTILQYDLAYRWRLQDLFGETSKESLTKSPRKEIKRLLAINRKREHIFNGGPGKQNPGKSVADKFIIFGILLDISLLFPPARRKLRKIIEKADFHKLQLDEADRYWCRMRTDYDFSHL